MPGLARLLEWAAELSPVEVVDEAPGAVDLDAEGSSLDQGAPDPEALAERLRGAPAVRGSVLASPEGARAVLLAGVPRVVRLPGQTAAALLLRLVQENGNLDLDEERDT